MVLEVLFVSEGFGLPVESELQREESGLFCLPVGLGLLLD